MISSRRSGLFRFTPFPRIQSAGRGLLSFSAVVTLTPRTGLRDGASSKMERATLVSERT